MPDRSETWDGGYIRRDKKNRAVYIIHQQVNGVRYEVSTRAHSETAAHAQLKLFQSNPGAYDPNGEQKEDPIFLDDDLIKDFLAYSKAKQNSNKWIGEQKRMLEALAAELYGVDLRGASLRDSILPALEKVANKHARTTIKALYTWLRRERHLISLSDDPVAGGQVACVQASKIVKKKKKAVSREHVELAISHLAGGWKDALVIQSETGWHVTEIQRFAQDGEIEPASQSQKKMGVHVLTGEPIEGIIIVQHKGGGQHRTAVTQKTLDAAQRLRERNGFSVEHYMRAVASACKAAGIKPFGPGKLRHSVATWLIDSGADMAAVATFLGHKSPATTKKFYATHATAKSPWLVPVPEPKKEAKEEETKQGG